MITGYKSILFKLIHLLVYADSSPNEKEIQSGLHAAKIEGVSENEFVALIEALKKRTGSVVYSEAIEDLKKQSRDTQIRCIAWLCLIANADGFMDKTEWQFIYKIYHTELKLPLDAVLQKQKELLTLKMKA
ncbi:MAG: TerB family tellurite resistance protein [Bacteroidetes bacterium]|nr:TerB family tellurite resistance protein [Bacteroidota bacterium]